MDFKINNTTIGKCYKTYIVAELSANHNKNFNTAKQLIKKAKEAGADAVKLQTFLPSTITINCKKDEHFR